MKRKWARNLVVSAVGSAWMPLVGADMERMNSLKKHAEAIAKATGRRIVLAEFSVRKDIEEILPEPPKT